MNNKSATNKLTIYLIKSEMTKFEDIIKSNSTSTPVAQGTLYTIDSRSKKPNWLQKFFSIPLTDDALKLYNANAQAIFLIRVLPDDGDPRIFGISFGLGRNLLKDSVIEDRFGLKVVLNSIDTKEDRPFRSIDKTSLGHTAKQSREQLSKYGDTKSFGIDIEQDIISSVTGKPKFDDFGKSISGKDALHISAQFDATTIPSLLKRCLEQFYAQGYKDTFDWIDHIRDLRDKDKQVLLNGKLIEYLNAEDFTSIWLAPPEIIDWADVKGFRYVRPRQGVIVQDLAIRELIGEIRERPLTTEILKKVKIYLISSESDEAKHRWNAYSCIYAEIELGGVQYILNNARWYEIDNSFVDKINRSIARINPSQMNFISYADNHRNENEYNIDLANHLVGSICLDADNIIHGGGRSKIELCDIITANKEMIHVKRYSGSAQLSHLFSQGAVSAELFLSDEEFRRKANERFTDRLKLADCSHRPDSKEYEIVFAIISKSGNALNLPFFSKVTLKNAVSKIESFGYNVSLAKISTVTEVQDGNDTSAGASW